jgi:hypothetical protein
MRNFTIVASALCALAVLGAGCAQKNSRPIADQERTRPTAPDSIKTPAVQSDSTRENELLECLGRAFRERNPKLATVRALELRAWDFLGPRLVIGWAIVGDRTFRGDFNDEMYGVFVVNETMTRVDRVVDVFPTPRWLDYEVHFGRVTADSVEIVGRGATYSDGPMRRTYKW